MPEKFVRIFKNVYILYSAAPIERPKNTCRIKVKAAFVITDFDVSWSKEISSKKIISGNANGKSRGGKNPVKKKIKKNVIFLSVLSI